MRNTCLLFLLLCCELVAGQGGKHKADEDETISDPKRLHTGCYFSTVGKTSIETQARPTVSTISTSCGGGMYKIKNMIKDHPSGYNHGTEHEADWIACIGAGNYSVPWSEEEHRKWWGEQSICQNHVDELLLNYQQKWHPYQRNEVCNMPTNEVHHRKIGPGTRYFLTKTDAWNFMLEEHTLIPVAVCRTHHEFFKKLSCKYKTFPRSNDERSCSAATATTTASPSTSDEDDQEYRPYYDRRYKQPESCPARAVDDAFFDFALRAEISNVHHYKPFNEWTPGTKRNKAYACRRITNRFLSIVAPGADDSFISEAIGCTRSSLWGKDYESGYHKLMTQIARRYHASASSTEREDVLSLVANDLRLIDVQEYIPGITEYRYQRAKQTARRGFVEVTDRTKVKYDKKKVVAFLQFLASPIVMVGLPYGERRVRMTDGTFQSIPNTIRKQRGSEIIGMYDKFLRSIGQFDELSLPHSTMYKIMGLAVATKRKSTACVDSFVADGEAAFDDSLSLLIELKDAATIDSFQFKKWRQMLDDGRQYLRTDYRLNVKKESEIADHCISHSLSSADDPRFATTCTHKHDQLCSRCEALDQVFFEILGLVEERLNDLGEGADEEMKEAKKRISFNMAKIMELKAHQLRSVHASNHRASIIEGLGVNEGLATADFAQKFLGYYHRERQGDYYGKRGVSYHIVYLYANVEGELVQHSFTNVIGFNKQDTLSTTQKFEDVFEIARGAGIRALHIRSDNAANYHTASTIASLIKTAQRKDIKLYSYSFSETQAGKSSSDRTAAEIKTHVRSHVDEEGERKAVSPREFFIAAISESILAGVSVGLCAIRGGSAAKVTGFDLISEKFHFEYEKDGIRVWRYAGIGKGVLVKGPFPENGGKIVCTERGGATLPDGTAMDEAKLPTSEDDVFWSRYKCGGKKKLKKGTAVSCDASEDSTDQERENNGHPEEDDGKERGLYHCSYPNCRASFHRLSNLEKHADSGRHKLSMEREPFTDFIRRNWGEAIREEKEAKTSLVKDVIKKSAKTRKVIKKSAAMDWASKKIKPAKRLTEDVKSFLVEAFNKGEASVAQRVTPEDLAERMRSEKMDNKKRFNPDHWLVPKQIASYFSRLARKKKAEEVTALRKGVTRGHRHRKDTKEEEETVDEEYIRAGLMDDLNEVEEDPDESVTVTGDTLMEEDVVEREIQANKLELFFFLILVEFLISFLILVEFLISL